MPERARRERETGDDVVTRRLRDEDDVVPAQREIEPLYRPAGLLRRVPEVIDPTRTVFDLRDPLLRVTSERDESGHGYLPCLLRPPPSKGAIVRSEGKPGRRRIDPVQAAL